MKKQMIRSAILLIASLGAVQCAAFAEDNSVVARVDEIEIHAGDIQSMIDNLPAREKEAILRDPTVLNQSVRMLLAQQLVLKEAKAKQWDKQTATVALIEKARDNVVVESYLQSVSKADDSFPSDADLKTAYEANKASLVVPRQFKLAQIYIATPKGESGDKSTGKLDAVKKSLKAANADFGAIALTQSDDKASFKNNGELGWLSENMLQPEIRAKVADLAKNAISEPIRMSDGWHIMKVLDVKESRQASFDEVRSRLAEQLRLERSRSMRQAYLSGLMKGHQFSVNELAISGFISKAQK
ncbi:MAG: peptidylprolyl isomerase [Chthoniobacteraceae bacterium]